MKPMLDRATPFLPWVGLILIVAGLVMTFVTGRFELLNNLLLGGGAILVLLFAMLSPDSVREMVSGRYFKYGASTILSIIFFAAIFSLLYWVILQNEEWRWDVTEGAENTAKPEIVELVNQADSPIEVLAFYRPSSFQKETTEEYLKSIMAESDNISYQFIDWEAEPFLAQQYEVTNDTVVFVKNRGTDNELTASTPFVSDRDVYGALLQVINPVNKTAYFLTGHGEIDITDGTELGGQFIVENLKELGFTIEQLDLRIEDAVPADASILVILAPQVALQQIEIEAIQAYTAGGGSLFLTRDAILSQDALDAESDGLANYLATDWGLTLRQDLVIDPPMAYRDLPLGIIIGDFGFSPIIDEDIRQYGMLLDTARSIEVSQIEGLTYVELLRTSAEAWGETDVEAQPQIDEGADAVGPLAIAVSAENPITGGRVVVMGETDFLRNILVSIPTANPLFITNAFNWLAKDEQTLELTPRPEIERSLAITAEQVLLIQLVSACFSPLLVAIIGGYMWWLRRKQR